MSSTVKRAATLAAVLALSVAAVIPAGAAPPPPSGPRATGVPAGKSAVITLITGDVVEITDAGGGNYMEIGRASCRERV